MYEDKIPYEINLKRKSNNEHINYTNLDINLFRSFSSKMGNYLEGMFLSVNKLKKAISDNMDSFKALAELLDIFEKIGSDQFLTRLYKGIIEENRVLVNRFRDENIFPPINFIANNNIQLDKDDKLSKWILSSKVKEYYMARIKSWKYKYEDEAINGMIEEVSVALDNNLKSSVSLLIFPLIERMLREEIFENRHKIPQREIRNILKKTVFDAVDSDDLYRVFIRDNLYCNTKNAKEFSRNMCHGVNIEKFTEKTAMNMIFIYDFLQEIIVFHKNN